MSIPLLDITGLDKQYVKGEPYALRGLDLKVEAGEFVAILGLSGSGKSTLIRCINRLIEPTAGRIRWRGEDVGAYRGAALRGYRRQIGMIFQDFHLIDRLSVRRNVLVGRFGCLSPMQAIAGRHGAQGEQAAADALARVGLEAYAKRRARELSGGQRQRVAIARALTQEPALILGDEPVSNLDPVTSIAILQLLQRLNREDGITLMINLHSVELAIHFAQRIVGIAKGRVVFDGPPAALSAAVLQAIYSSGDSKAERADAAALIEHLYRRRTDKTVPQKTLPSE